MPAIYFKGKRYGTGVKGAQGEQGVSVQSATIAAENELIITLSDGREISAGKITVSGEGISLENYYTKAEVEELIANKLATAALSDAEVEEAYDNA